MCRFGVAALILITLLPTLGAAEPLPILVENSRSPDGRKEITITDDSPDVDQGIATGLAQIRAVGSSKILGSFQYSSFGQHPDQYAFKALWQPSSRSVAIYWPETRGFIICKVYAPSRRGYVQVKLPDYGERILRDNPKEDANGHGGERPIKWLKGNRLRIEATYRDIIPTHVPPDGEWMQSFWVTLRFVHSGKRPKARLESIKFAPLSVYKVGR